MKTMMMPAAVVAALASGTAGAQDQARVVGDGLRAELSVGYDAVVSHDDLEGAADNIPDDLTSARFGIAVGYDRALSAHWSIGAELGWGKSVSGGIDARFARDRLRLELGRDLDAAVRVGYRPNPGLMLYARAGYANSAAVVRLDEWIGNRYETTRVSDTSGGLRIGGGIEAAISDRIYAKAEYRRTYYGDLSYQPDATRHQLLGGAGIRF